MYGIKVRDPNMGIQGTLREWDHGRRILYLKNDVIVVDFNSKWQYYNEMKQRWFPCFPKN